MTRSEILRDFNVDENGKIRSPGKFEGEMLFMPHFYECYLNGCSTDVMDEEDTMFSSIEVDSEDLQEFPELAEEDRVIWFYEREDGFICQCNDPQLD